MADIIVSDDQNLIRTLLKKILENEGHNVILSENGDETLELLKRNKPSIVITDIFMPGEMNGEDVINELKSNYPEINVIAMSASENFPFKEARPDIFMEKPFKGHEVINAVNSLLNENIAVPVGEV